MILILSVKKPRDCPLKKPRDCPLKNSGKNSGTVPELVRETTAMNWAVGGGIER
jgi:hypothetical protein